MTPEQANHARELFMRLCDAPRAQHARMLDEHSRGDALVRRRVEALLAIEDDSRFGPDFLEQPLLPGAAVREILDAAGEHPVGGIVGETGEYRVLRLLGEGGMGMVYEAEQASPRRRVAVKLIRQSIASQELLRRFRQECELLGRMNHPGIANVYSSGMATFTLSDGARMTSPFLAMELVEGRPLDEYAEAHRLSVADRLELMGRVCDAVQYAHQMGVIHRDLKPSNVLVADEATKPRSHVATKEAGLGGEALRGFVASSLRGFPKVLDFGVARAVDGEFQQATLTTQSGRLIGTPAYMSPEQVRGDSRLLDTRTDIYSLGVILYELLSGKPPIELRDTPLPEAVRRITEVEPTPLGRVRAALRGDLEAIVGKALEKDRERRYSSAAELAADIRRFLRHEPILARPHSAAYQLRKFARRHKGLVGGLAAAMFMLLAGVMVSTGLYLRAEREREEARRQADIAQAVSTFLNQDMLAAADPYQAAKPDLSVREVLDAAAEKIGGRFPNEPVIEAAVRMTLGTSYVRLGEYAAAQPHVERSFELRQAGLGEDHADTLAAMHTLAELYYHQGDYARAEALSDQLLALARAALGAEHKETLSIMNGLAFIRMQMGRASEAEPLMLESVSVGRRRIPDDEKLVEFLMNLAMLYMNTARQQQAEPLLTEAITLAGRLFGPDHPRTLLASGNLAALYNILKQHDRAVPILMQVLEAQRRTLGAEHPQALMTLGNLGFAYLRLKNLEEAAPVLEECLSVRERTIGAEHPHTLISMEVLSDLRVEQQRYSEAEELLKQCQAARRKVLGEDHANTILCLHKFGRLYEAQGRYAEAEPYYVELVQRRKATLPEGHPQIAAALKQLGECLTKLNRTEEAQAVLREAEESSEPRPPRTGP